MSIYRDILIFVKDPNFYPNRDQIELSLKLLEKYQILDASKGIDFTILDSGKLKP